LNNPTQRFRPPPLRFGEQKFISPRPLFLFARLFFGFAKNFSEGDGLQVKRAADGVRKLLIVEV